jgi:hypothetical protein
MTKQKPIPHEDLVGRALTIPFQGPYRATRGFLKDLTKAEAAYREEIVEIRSKLNVDAEYHDTPDVQRLSLAVQTFAALTIEAAVSFYAVMRFGGDNHGEHFRWGQVVDHLARICHHCGVPLASDSELLKLVRELMEARHRIVHPFSAEFSGTRKASIQSPARVFPDDSAAAAREAVANLDRAFGLLQQLDPEHGWRLVPF